MNTAAQVKNLYRIVYLVSRVYARFGRGGTYANMAQVAR